ncbi:MAG: (2Fe-2S)-binding protein [Bdellovibrionales bacterium]|nr:(2Fe-2S)-binding protein [Bdellovibrionales bacterium]
MTSKAIHFLPADKSCVIKKEASVLEVALRNEIDIPHSCGGMGSCTTCRVIVVQSDGPLPERNELEMDIATMRDFAPEERLSCQLPALPGLVVRVPTALLDDDGNVPT